MWIYARYFMILIKSKRYLTKMLLVRSKRIFLLKKNVTIGKIFADKMIHFLAVQDYLIMNILFLNKLYN